MKLIPEHQIVNVTAMKDGDIAVIKEWNYENRDNPMPGRLVMRYIDDLISLGEDHENSWPEYFIALDQCPEVKEQCNVIILEKGKEYKIKI